MKIAKSYKVRLITYAQDKAFLREQFRLNNFVWNYFLGQNLEILQTNKDKPKEERQFISSAYDMQKELTQLKKQDDYAFLNRGIANSLNRSLDTLGTLT